MKEFNITTTGTQAELILTKLGIYYVNHPTNKKNILPEFFLDELLNDAELKQAYDDGHIEVKDEFDNDIFASENDSSIVTHIHFNKDELDKITDGDGDAQKLRGTPISTTSPVIDQILSYNGTNWSPSNNSAAPTTYSNDYYSESESYTSSTSWVEKLSFTIPIGTVPPGRYRLGWFYEWNYNSSSRKFKARVQFNDSTYLMDQEEEPKDSNQWVPSSGFGYIDIVNTILNKFDLDFCSSNSKSVSGIRRARMEIWRVI